ncbi:hypothetical protein YPPY88_4750, partial [Yersinia pestis PY-88]
MAGGVEP